MKTLARLSASLITVLLSYQAAQAQMSIEDMLLLDEGFRVFTEETFDGNGRTCATCHLPEEQYNIAPSDIRKLKGEALQQVLASNVPGLENPTLVMERGLFNTRGGPPPGDDALDCDNGMECEHIEFRGSMTVGPLALTTASIGTLGLPSPALGWSANGSPTGFMHHGVPDLDADGSIRAFANGAVAQHFTTCLERTLNVCFRLATAAELDAMEAFQNWLGRREEFEIANMTFNDGNAQVGKALYMSNEASCNVCHRNGGARFSPFIFSNPAGPNINQHSDVNDESHRLTELTGVFIPRDEGIGIDPPGPAPFEHEAFNSQPVIEAARKEAFFHNHAFLSNKRGKPVPIEFGGGIEGATTFYFREPFVGSQVHAAVQGLFRIGGGDGSRNLHLDTLAEFEAFAGKNGINVMGAFIRSLSAFYSIRDCERLVQEAIDRILFGVSPDLPARHCGFNLDDVTEVLQAARVPSLYSPERNQARVLKMRIESAVARGDHFALIDLLSDLESLRTRIATTPDLP